MHSSLKKRLLHEMTLFKCLDREDNGDKTFDSGTVYSCLREEKPKLVRTLTGEEEVSNTQLYLDSVLDIKQDDEVDFEGRRPVKAFSRFNGLKKNTGTTVVYL